MRIADIKPLTLADLADNLINLLGGTELSSIDPNVRAALIAAIGNKPAEVRQHDSDAKIFMNKAQASISQRNDTAAGLGLVIGNTRDFLKAAKAPAGQFELAGFDYPFETRARAYVAKKPSQLAVVGFSNQVNQGKFKGNNRTGAVTYEIWRRVGKDGTWAILTTTRKKVFEDTGVSPGQYYQYKVRAVAAKNSSAYSNTASVGGG